jgi:hypothetical protein
MGANCGSQICVPEECKKIYKCYTMLERYQEEVYERCRNPKYASGCPKRESFFVYSFADMTKRVAIDQASGSQIGHEIDWGAKRLIQSNCSEQLGHHRRGKGEGMAQQSKPVVCPRGGPSSTIYTNPKSSERCNKCQSYCRRISTYCKCGRCKTQKVPGEGGAPSLIPWFAFRLLSKSISSSDDGKCDNDSCQKWMSVQRSGIQVPCSD